MKRSITIPAVLLLAAMSASAAAESSKDSKAFLRCGGWDCSLTAVEVSGTNSSEAWALGRTTREDAMDDCSAGPGNEPNPCVTEQMGRPPVVITADCVEGIASYYGGEEYKMSAKAKAGKFTNAQEQGYWEGETSHRARTTLITWFQLLCPTASKTWNMRED